MRIQIEVRTFDRDGNVDKSGVYGVVESDMLPPVGARMHLNGFGIVRVFDHLWDVTNDDGAFLSSGKSFIHVHLITVKPVTQQEER
jgi:hypothetical protein